MKRSTISFSGFSRFVGLAVVLAGGGVVHASIPVLPNALRKGVNIPSIYGNANFMFSRWPNLDYNSGPTPWLYPYTATRMGELLREDGVYEDFHIIAKAGFGHVRIPIDPLALNMRQSQPIPQRYQAKADAPIWGPLLEDIQAANDAGLAVILDFHPVILSPQHMQKATRDFWKNDTMDTTGYTYPGTYSYPFLEGTGAPTDPLSVFWKSFVLELESQFDEAGKPLIGTWCFSRY